VSISADHAQVVSVSPGVTWLEGNILPVSNVTYSLGGPEHQWKDLHLSGNTVYLGSLELKDSGSSLEINLKTAPGQLRKKTDIIAGNLIGDGSGLSNIQASNVVGLTQALDTIDASSVTSNIFSGNGSGLSNIQASNVVGLTQALDTIDASSVTSNIFSGNGSGLSNIQASNVVGLTQALDTIDASSVTSNIFSGNGSGLSNIQASNVVGLTQALDTKVDRSGDTITGNLRVQGNLIVDSGNVVYIDSEIQTSDQIIVENIGTGPALSINQAGVQDILQVQDDGVTVAKWYDGGSLALAPNTSTVLDTFSPNDLLTVHGSVTATTFSGSGANLTSLNASNLSSGTVATARLPSASTSASGIVQLSSATNSTSTTLAATASAVKAAYDLASGKVSKTGDTITGDLLFTGTREITMRNSGTTSTITMEENAGDKNIVIQYDGTGSGAGNFFRIGSDTSGWNKPHAFVLVPQTGYVGIGTTSPARNLHIAGSTAGIQMGSSSVVTDTTSGIFWHSTINYGIYRTGGAWTNNYQQLKLDWPTGIILAPAPSDGTSHGKSYLDVQSSILATGNITAYASDKRLKTNIVPLQNPLDTIKKLNGYNYTWRDDIEGLTMRGKDIGLLAQDLEDAGLHECITLAPFDNDGGVSKSGHEYKTIHYNKLHALWAAALNEQQHIIESQQAQIESQQAQIESQQAQIDSQQSRFDTLEKQVAMLLERV